MLQGVFRTKERRVIAAIIGLAAIIISIWIFTGYRHNKDFIEQAVMAENYLKAGSYEQAIEAYLKALSMKSGDEQPLTIGLADAYAGVDDYDKALEVLRSYYKKNPGDKVKEKIEEITSEKADYDFIQSISLAEVYFANKEYEKAIGEFEKAKLIKSREALSYQRIAEAYIELDNYSRAKEEVTQGLEITKDKKLELTMAVVDACIKKEQYDTLIEQAAEYILQENYEEGIARYKEAIALLPKEKAGYIELAKTYLSGGEYEDALQLLGDGVKLIGDDELNGLLEQAAQLKELADLKNNLLSSLYQALKRRNLEAVQKLMDTSVFQELIGAEAPVFYNVLGNASKEGLCLVVYGDTAVYYGDIVGEEKEGSGIYFTRTLEGSESSIYYYDGEWERDKPDGYGETVEENISLDASGQEYSTKTKTVGIYHAALEDGRMKKIFYVNNELTGDLEYTAENGIPLQLSLEGSSSIAPSEDGSYIIGSLILDGKPTGEYYRVERHTVWGVRPLMEQE